MNNMQKSPLQKAVERAHALGRRAVIPFITAGFPDKESFWTHLSRIDEAGADIIEIGVPFSDPVADGPVIEQASRDALARGVSLKWILDGLKARKGGFSAELVLMGYVNPFYRYGLEQLALDAEEAGVSGFIVPDMPLEESGMFREAFSPHGLTLVTLVAPNTSVDRMREYKPYTSGFVYVVSVLGTTGGKASLERSVTETMRRARSVFDVPLALGFGLQTPDQLETLPEDARPDAAVLGSALLRHIGEGKDAGEFLENGPEVELDVSLWFLRMGLHNLLCRPFLFYLVMGGENADSQSASILFTYYSIFNRIIVLIMNMLHIFNIICWRESRIFLTEKTFRVFRKTVVTDSFPLTADCEFLIYIHNHISLAVLWERFLFVH